MYGNVKTFFSTVFQNITITVNPICPRDYGIIFFGNLASACLIGYSGQTIYWSTFTVGILLLFRSFVDQFQGECSLVVSIILESIYFYSSLFLLGMAVFEHTLHYRSTLIVVISFIIIFILAIYGILPIWFIYEWKVERKGKNLFVVLSKHEGYMLIIIDLIIGCISLIQSFSCFSLYYSEKDSFDYHWISLFMVINSIMYFVISLLHSLSNPYFKHGINFGIAWGIIACVISLFIAFATMDVYDIPISYNLAIHGIYSLMITITSLLLKYLRGKEN